MADELPLERLEEALSAVLDAQNPVALICYTPFGVVRGILERGPLPGREDHSRDLTGETDLVIGGTFSPRVVDDLWTGLHEPGTSHFALCRAFADDPVLRRAIAHAEATGYEGHEFGDACLVRGRSERQQQYSVTSSSQSSSPVTRSIW